MPGSHRHAAGRGRLVAWLLVTAAGCHSVAPGGRDSRDAAAEAGPTAAPRCLSAYERVTSRDSGHELAAAYREHVPTPGEKALAAALWAVLISGARTGGIEQGLFQRLTASPALAEIPIRYPSAFRSCAEPATSLVAQALISEPPRCTDDCRIGMTDVAAVLGERLAGGLRSLEPAGGLVKEADAMLTVFKRTLANEALSGLSLEAAARLSIPPEGAAALLYRVFSLIGEELAIVDGAAQLAGSAEVNGPLAATAAIIALGGEVARLKVVADRIHTCRTWKAQSCPCQAEDCGCVGVGESALGAICCGQGGPGLDAPWYEIRANDTCCVLNRAAYAVQGDVCRSPPDGRPGPCPMCRTDADCCDRVSSPTRSDRCLAGRCCEPDGSARPGTMTTIDHACCSGLRYVVVGSASGACAPAP